MLTLKNTLPLDKAMNNEPMRMKRGKKMREKQ